MKRLFALLLLLSTAVSVSRAGCSPEKLVRVIYRDRTPGITDYSFEGQPVTIFRLGDRYGRIEEVSAPEFGRHSVWITNEPDSWAVNLLTGTGTYAFNRTGQPGFRAPVFTKDEVPESLRSMEFGCELEFMKERASGPPHAAKLRDLDVLNYEFKDGAYLVRLAVIERFGKPFAIGLYRDGELVRFLRYAVYQDSLPPDTRPFWPPANIEYSAAE